ncbi:MAG: hypothetical protein M5U28_25050 [Sandaracinaceae bacterium]|nr:hypothetical protein [Sandaracinaceae bacterium]
MKIRALAILLSLASAAPASAQPSPHDPARLFPHEAAIEASGGYGALHRLALPAEVLERARPELSDVRIHDAQGRDVPYLVDSGARAWPRDGALPDFATEPLAVARRIEEGESLAPTWREILEVAPPGRAPEGARWIVSVESSRASFVRTVVVRAIEGEARTELARGSIYRFRDPLRERLSIALPPLPPGASRLEVELAGEGGYVEPALRFTATREPVSPPTPGAGHDRACAPDARGHHGDRAVAAARHPAGSTAGDHAEPALPSRGARPRSRAGPGAARDRARRGLPRARARGRRGARDRALAGPRRAPARRGDRRRQPAARRAGLRGPGAPARAPLLRARDAGHAALRRRARARRATTSPASPARCSATPWRRSVRARPRSGRCARTRASTTAPRCASPCAPGARPSSRASRTSRPSAWRTRPRASRGCACLRRCSRSRRSISTTCGSSTPRAASGRTCARLTRSADVVVGSAGAPSVGDRRSTYVITPPVPRARVDALVLHTEAPYLSRPYVVRGIDDDGRRVELTRGTLQRAPDEASPLEITLHGVRVSRLELEIEDGSDAPIELDRVELSIPSPSLFLAAPRGDYRLLVGDPEAAAPDYEIARAADLVLSVQAADGEVGAPAANPAHVTPPWYESAELSTWIVWAVLLLAVIVLGLVTLRLARAAPEAPPAPSAAPSEAPPRQRRSTTRAASRRRRPPAEARSRSPSEPAARWRLPRPAGWAILIRRWSSRTTSSSSCGRPREIARRSPRSTIDTPAPCSRSARASCATAARPRRSCTTSSWRRGRGRETTTRAAGRFAPGSRCACDRAASTS